MSNDGSVTRWIKSLKDDEDEATRQLFDRYWERLVQMVGGMLKGRSILPADREDVAQSAMNSFFLGARNGCFPNLEDRGNLHRLLVTITARKINAHTKRAGRKKRSRDFSSIQEDDDRAIDLIIGKEPTPEFAFQVAEELHLRLASLSDDQLREIACLKLDNYTNREIANLLDVSNTTVERRLRLIRKEWSDDSE